MRRLAGKHGTTIAIIALLVLNVVLIVPLFTGWNNVPDGAAVASSPDATTPAPTHPAPSPSPDAASSPSSDPSLKAGQPRRLLAVDSNQIAWRAQPAGCGQKSKIEVTTDGGKTWRSTDSGLKSVVRLKAFGDSSVFAIGADKNCNPTYAVAAYPRATWQRDDSMLANTWFRVPGHLNTVHDPQGNTSHPCGKGGLVDLAGQGDDQAVALCADGSLRTRDGRANWHTAVQKSNAVALNADDNHFVLGETTDKCDGVAVQTFTLDGTGLQTRKRHCMKGIPSHSESVAVSNRFGTILVWSGNAVKANLRNCPASVWAQCHRPP